MLAVAGFGALASAADATPKWSNQFANTPIGYTVFDDGPLCLLPFETAAGPRLYLGGAFSTIGTLPIRALAAYDGSQWTGVTGLTPNSGTLRIAGLTTMQVSGTQRVVLGGFFLAPSTQDGLGYLDDTPTVRAFPSGPTSPFAWFAGVFAWNSPAGPEIILSSGRFPQSSDYVYRYRTTGGFGTMPPGVITVTNAFAQFDDGAGPAVYIGVTRVGVNPSQPVTKWDGTTLTSLPAGVVRFARALCVHDDGSGPALYAAGNGFGRYRNGAWTEVAGAPAFGVEALASFNDGSGLALYAAGQFTSASGVPAVNIARLRNGIWEALGSGLTGGTPKAMAVFDEDGPGPRPAGLYVIGRFTQADGINSRGIARWGQTVAPTITAHPQSVVTCGTAAFAVSATTVCTDAFSYTWQLRSGPTQSWSTISNGPSSLPGGQTLTASGATTSQLSLSSGPSGWIGTVEVHCIVTNTCGSVTSDTATLTTTPRCSPSDIAGNASGPVQCSDGTVDGSDFIAFINSFAIGDATVDRLADVAGSGPNNDEPDGTIDGTDFIAFINAFAIGC
jgi:hypothetical protein